MADALSPALAQKLGRLIPLLASDKEGEALATVRAIGRTLKAAGSDFHAFAKAVIEPRTVVIYRTETTPPRKPAPRPKCLLEVAGWCRTHYAGRLSVTEERFTVDMLSRLTVGRWLSEKQEKWLRAIYFKLGGAP